MLDQLNTNLAVSAALGLYFFLEKEGNSESSLINYRHFFCRNSNIDVRVHDDIHLLFVTFDAKEPAFIFAVGDLSSDAYSVYEHHEEVALHEHVAYWKPTANHNPILNYQKLMNKVPTVEFNAICNLLRNGEYRTTKSYCDENKAAHFELSGMPDTISLGTSFKAIFKLCPIENKITINGFSDLSFGINPGLWDSYHVVKDGYLLDKGYVYNEIGDLIERLGLEALAVPMIEGHH